MKYDKNKAINIIVNAAENYMKYLQDKVFLIVYQEKEKTKTAQVEFRDSHFLHLTGVKTNITAGRFYEKCINHKLSPADFEFDKGGKIQQKMVVLPFLHELWGTLKQFSVLALDMGKRWIFRLLFIKRMFVNYHNQRTRYLQFL